MVPLFIGLCNQNFLYVHRLPYLSISYIQTCHISAMLKLAATSKLYLFNTLNFNIFTLKSRSNARGIQLVHTYDGTQAQACRSTMSAAKRCNLIFSFYVQSPPKSQYLCVPFLCSKRHFPHFLRLSNPLFCYFVHTSFL